jgi:hypothetical protein
MSRPLLLLDVDGPLNPYRGTDRRQAGYTKYRLDGFEVWLNAAHGPMLTAFADRYDVELVWATTWEHNANDMIGCRIGLPKLPVIEWGFKAHHWKFDAVLEFAAGRPLAWLDDDFGRFRQEREWFDQQRAGVPTLLHHVDPAVGITADDLVAVGAWFAMETAA